jgi:hypothetical protein
MMGVGMKKYNFVLLGGGSVKVIPQTEEEQKSRLLKIEMELPYMLTGEAKDNEP